MKVGNEGSENKVGFEAVLVKRPELTQLRGNDAMLLTQMSVTSTTLLTLFGFQE